jgi:hypothetical protein
MRIRYVIAFTREVIIDDHWSVPFQGGTCRVVEDKGIAKALEVTFSKQPLDLAPSMNQALQGHAKFDIAVRDTRVDPVQQQLKDAMSFLQCYFEVGLATDGIEAFYEGESPEEEELISVKSMQKSPTTVPLPLRFDLLTRALMAAEDSIPPRFEATLASSARAAMAAQQFIDSFRYAFLLMESVYGKGQFRSEALKSAFKSDTRLMEIVSAAISGHGAFKIKHASDTATLLVGTPSAGDVIDHLVDKRGFYFHGNRRRQDAWKPDEQHSAQALAILMVNIVQLISQDAAQAMFDRCLEIRHNDDAVASGATLVFDIQFKFREPGETFSRDHSLRVNALGTKVTSENAFGMTKVFCQHFEENFPVAALERAECTLQSTGQKVFALELYVPKGDGGS